MAWSTAGYIEQLETRNGELREQVSQLRVRVSNLERELQLMRNQRNEHDKDTTFSIDTVSKPK
jgi:TolA-binding protein